MIIFGLKSVVKLLAMVNLVCRNCHNPAAQRVLKVTRWFTLFFIPVFPVGVSRSMTCTFCGIGSKLSKEDAEHLEQSARGGGPQGPPPGQPPQQGWPAPQGQPGHGQQQAPGSGQPLQGWGQPGQQPGGYRQPG